MNEDKIKDVIHKEQNHRNVNALIGLFGLFIRFSILDFIYSIIDVFTK